jgi:hypothetical protein
VGGVCFGVCFVSVGCLLMLVLLKEKTENCGGGGGTLTSGKRDAAAIGGWRTCWTGAKGPQSQH